ncbi:MAG: universal stress protein [Desulfobacterales bacterium]|nr:MAG: universal stress protein [Desulfobacterales bacterium]
MELPEIKIKKILYATDLSDSARYAFAFAVSLTDLYKAKLVILHVMHQDPSLDEKVSSYVSSKQWEEIKKRHFDEAREALIGKRREHLAIRDVLDKFRRNAEKEIGEGRIDMDEILVERGNAVEQIIKVSEERNCDLIVMGRHGYGALKDALMGGTARGVLRRSRKPVLLVRLPEDEA